MNMSITVNWVEFQDLKSGETVVINMNKPCVLRDVSKVHGGGYNQYEQYQGRAGRALRRAGGRLRTYKKLEPIAWSESVAKATRGAA